MLLALILLDNQDEMTRTQEVLQDVVIKFAGDSGDGMQLTGTQFTNNTALLGADLSTFPDFPAEIRAPQGTLPGVSGYQLRFSSDSIYTPGDAFDVLVAMNAAALKTNLKQLKKGGKIIVNTDGFDAKNLRLANYPDGINPIENDSLEGYEVIKMDVTKMTRESLKDIQMGIKEKDRAKNMFVLGFLYWMYGRDMKNTEKFLEEKFGKKPEILESNLRVLRAGYNYGDTTETFTTQYKVEKAKIAPGNYRSIMGNQALAYGLIAASVKWCQPILAWLMGSPARTVSEAFNKSTPCCAHFSRLPWFGMGAPTSSCNSLKMFWRDGGGGTPCCTEKLSPCAWRGP